LKNYNLAIFTKLTLDDIVCCFFSGYSMIAVVFQLGDTTIRIKDWAFDHSDAPVIKCLDLLMVGCCLPAMPNASPEGPCTTSLTRQVWPMVTEGLQSGSKAAPGA
jgi:hypothetical protein